MRAHSSCQGAPSRGHNRGFTLVELVISIMLLGLLGAVGATMISDSFLTTMLANAEADSEGKARYAMERLAREIREIKYDTTNSSYCIFPTPTIAANMAADNLVFYKMTSGSTYNSTCATNAYTVTITRIGANLTLGYTYASHPPADLPSMTLSSTVSNPTGPTGTKLLTYLDATGTETTSASGANAVNFVLITLVVKDATSGQSITQRTRVALRNK